MNACETCTSECPNPLCCETYIRHAKRETMIMQFKEWVEKKATKQQLKDKLLQYNEMWLKFDQFLIDELGEETYADIAREFGIKQSAEFLLNMGATEAEVREFTNSLKGEGKPQA